MYAKKMEPNFEIWVPVGTVAEPEPESARNRIALVERLSAPTLPGSNPYEQCVCTLFLENGTQLIYIQFHWSECNVLES
jgi:hypothetical protein